MIKALLEDNSSEVKEFLEFPSDTRPTPRKEFKVFYEHFTLFQFLEKVTFSKFEYDVSTLETLNRIKNISDKYLYAKNI